VLAIAAQPEERLPGEPPWSTMTLSGVPAVPAESRHARNGFDCYLISRTLYQDDSRLGKTTLTYTNLKGGI
jgi:hypothetical protein